MRRSRWRMTPHLVGCLLVAHLLLGGCSQGENDEQATCELVEGFEGACPADMAFVPGTNCCIDRFEASIDSDGAALSTEGVLPTTGVTFAEAEEACAAAGKMLCLEAVWDVACTANGERRYPYGDDYEPLTCSGESSTAELVPTGSMEGCEGGVEGVFDMSGNAFELVAPENAASEYYRLLGGMFLNGNDSLLCSMFTIAERPQDINGAGFRCCTLAVEMMP